MVHQLRLDGSFGFVLVRAKDPVRDLNDAGAAVHETKAILRKLLRIHMTR